MSQSSRANAEPGLGADNLQEFAPSQEVPMFERLTLKGIKARPVLLKLERPIVARIATITDWATTSSDGKQDQQNRHLT